MNTTRRQQLEYVAVVAAALLIAACNLAGWVAYPTVAPDSALAYWLHIADVGLTLVLVPAALKLMTFSRIHASASASEKSYLRWSEVRLAMLATPLLLNVSHYFLLGRHTSSAYLALIVAVAMLFIWPSEERKQHERA